MLSKLKIWVMAIGAAALAILYALFRVEKTKRKEAELHARVAEENAELVEKQAKSLDKAVSYRAEQVKKHREQAEAAKHELEKLGDEILDDKLPDNIIRLLNQNSNKKSSDKDT